MTINDLKLTDLEKTVLENLINNLYAEPGFSDVDANDISRETKISTKSIRGVLSSLVKKEIISLHETETYGVDKQYVIIYLNEKFWYLHPTWSKEISNA
jgi:predicted transcriptional regulator